MSTVGDDILFSLKYALPSTSLVMNNKVNGTWQQAEQGSNFTTAKLPNGRIGFTVRVDADGFHVSTRGGLKLWLFKHRSQQTPWSSFSHINEIGSDPPIETTQPLPAAPPLPPLLPSCEDPPSPPYLPPSPPDLPPLAPPVCTPPPNGVLTPLRETAPAAVRLTVWLPQTLTVILDDPILQPIAGLLHEPACLAQRWQTSAVRAVASVGGEGLTTVHGLDVTKLVSFVVLNGSVAMVDGNIVSALTPGLTAVVVDAFQSAGALLRVDAEPVTVTGIVSLLVNEAA